MRSLDAAAAVTRSTIGKINAAAQRSSDGEVQINDAEWNYLLSQYSIAFMQLSTLWQSADATFAHTLPVPTGMPAVDANGKRISLYLLASTYIVTRGQFLRFFAQ